MCLSSVKAELFVYKKQGRPTICTIKLKTLSANWDSLIFETKKRASVPWKPSTVYPNLEPRFYYFKML